MPKPLPKDGDVKASAVEIARMADRMHRLGGEGRRQNYVEKARARLKKGPQRRSDAATVAAAGG